LHPATELKQSIGSAAAHVLSAVADLAPVPEQLPSADAVASESKHPARLHSFCASMPDLRQDSARELIK